MAHYLIFRTNLFHLNLIDMKNSKLKSLLIKIETVSNQKDTVEDFSPLSLNDKLAQASYGGTNQGCANNGCNSGTNVACFNTACGGGANNRGCQNV
jgi:hypothetical protein